MENRKKAFDTLKKEMVGDKSLPLRKSATNLVLGEGNLDADIICIGEAPGFWEDKKGRPFVGAAGKLLDRLLSSIKLERSEGFTTGGSKDEVFISNVICFRPPENRDPTPEEISAFQPYIDRLINIIKPSIIITLGRFSMGKFLPGVKISSIHGRAHTINWRGRETVIVPMYHPAAALRRGEIMQAIRIDFEKIPAILSKIEKKENKEVVQQMQLV
jgi:DNA polymerase